MEFTTIQIQQKCLETQYICQLILSLLLAAHSCMWLNFIFLNHCLFLFYLFAVHFHILLFFLFLQCIFVFGCVFVFLQCVSVFCCIFFLSNLIRVRTFDCCTVYQDCILETNVKMCVNSRNKAIKQLRYDCGTGSQE